MSKSFGIPMIVVAALMILRSPSAQGKTTTSTTTLTTTSPCPLPPCALLIGCRPVPGSDGCPICACPDYNCEDITCGPDQECVMEDVECPPDTTPCFPQPTCVPPYDTTASSTTTQTTTDSTTISTTTLTTTPPCPIYTCGPLCNLHSGPDGCPICGCSYYTCEGVVCGPGEECVMQHVECPTVPTVMVQCLYPRCSPFKDTTASSIFTLTTTDSTTVGTTTLTTTFPCPIPLCFTECPPVTGPDGCMICDCPDYTCENVTCGPGQHCVVQDVKCPPEWIGCLPKPTCIPPNDTTASSIFTLTTTDSTTIGTTTLTTTFPCPIPLCFTECPPVTGPNGCIICDCPDYTCENVTCGPGQHCVVQDVECPPEWIGCLPKPTCIPPYETTTPCPLIKCAPDCVPDEGPDECPTCACPPTCEDMNCAKDEECVLQEVLCKKAPCFPQPTCVPKNDSCTGTPNTNRCGRFRFSWFYNSSANACQKFRYYGCTPSPNTFPSRRACEGKCKGTVPPICLAVLCNDDCYTFESENQCPRCICPNPCKDFKCGADEECKLREVTCSEDLCTPEPFCAA